jgi:2-amino-4-hydroxy-6-hydroxymethyldihydropteridine diphosphokinase
VQNDSIIVYLGLGSNLGNRRDNLERALDMLGQRLTLEVKSAIYETEPEDFPDQPLFLNMVCQVRTTLAPEALLALTRGIEIKIGRVSGRPSGPRVIDIDILLYADMILETPDLKIPHPRMDKRAFVLVPLNQIAPDLIPPGQTRSVQQLLADLENGVQGVFRFAEIWDDKDDNEGTGDTESEGSDVSVDG